MLQLVGDHSFKIRFNFIIDGVYILEKDRCHVDSVGWGKLDETFVSHFLFFFLYLEEGRSKKQRVACSSLTVSVPEDIGQPLNIVLGSLICSMF